jgi:protein TonB
VHAPSEVVPEERVAASPGRPGGLRSRREPVYEPEYGVVSSPGREGGRRRSRTIPLSLVVHTLAVLAILVIPAYEKDALPTPQAAVRAFLVEPKLLAPPPPPPPPALRSAPVVQAHPPEVKRFVAPVVIPDEIVPEAGPELGLATASPGGVEGGVPGGVVGGVVGGIPDAPAPPEPLRAGRDVKEPRKIKDVPPQYPEKARVAGVEGLVILECLISTAGRVQHVEVLRSIPLLDDAALTAVKQWVYTPTLVGGVPVPVLMTVTVHFGLK